MYQMSEQKGALILRQIPNLLFHHKNSSDIRTGIIRVIRCAHTHVWAVYYPSVCCFTNKLSWPLPWCVLEVFRCDTIMNSVPKAGWRPPPFWRPRPGPSVAPVTTPPLSCSLLAPFWPQDFCTGYSILKFVSPCFSNYPLMAQRWPPLRCHPSCSLY
jgi:hypothetical protein